jgi:hypothetical protein
MISTKTCQLILSWKINQALENDRPFPIKTRGNYGCKLPELLASSPIFEYLGINYGRGCAEVDLDDCEDEQLAKIEEYCLGNFSDWAEFAESERQQKTTKTKIEIENISRQIDFQQDQVEQLRQELKKLRLKLKTLEYSEIL